MSESAPEHRTGERLKQCPAFYHIPFDPVPVKTRHDGWTPERQRGFIDRLVVTGCVARSARAVGMTPQSAHNLARHPKAASFRCARDEALASGRSYQRDLAILRCIEGEAVPVMYRGRRVGTRVRHDNALIIAVLNATPPPKPESGEDPGVAFDHALDALCAPNRVAEQGGRVEE